MKVWAIVLSLFIAGCAAKAPVNDPPVSPEGRLVLQARAVVLAADGLLTATDAAVTAKLVTPQQAIQVAEKTKLVGELALQLVNVLRIAEVAQNLTKETLLGDATALLDQISKALISIPASVRGAITMASNRAFGAVARVRLSLGGVS